MLTVKPGDANVEKAFAVLAKKAGIHGMVGGQVLDVERAGLPMDEDQLAFIYENKTGALIAAACMCGAYLAGADDAVVAQLDEAAYAVGFAFQVHVWDSDEATDAQMPFDTISRFTCAICLRLFPSGVRSFHLA